MHAIATDADSDFAELVAHERSGWVAAATVILGSVERAEESVQEVLERTFQRWDSVGAMDKPGAWVRRAVVNDAISAWRRATSERAAVERLDSAPAHSNELQSTDHELWAAVRRLPEQQCRAVALHYAADAPISDVAEELDLSISATKTLLYRARQTLRAQLKEAGDV